MEASQSKTTKFKQLLPEKLTSIYPPPETQLIKTESKHPTKLPHQNFQKVSPYAQLIKGENETTILSAQDRKEQVQTTVEWSSSAHGLFIIKFENNTCWGAGIMIGPNIVLTAGHNLYSHQNKVYADLESMRFSPGMNGDEAPFGSVEVGEYFISPDYIKEGKEDYGILVLKEPIGDLTGYLGLTCSRPGEINKKRTNIPKDFRIPGMEATPSYIYQEEGSTKEMIHGQSESGVWYQEGENSNKVHIQGTTIFLTRAMYQQIYQWLQQTSFYAFLKLENEKRLEFSNQAINTQCISLLMTCNLDGLTILDLSRSEIGDKEANVLAKNSSWTSLSELDLSHNIIGTEGAQALAQNTSWINLSNLRLSLNRISSEGAKALAQNNCWTRLLWLTLDENNVGSEGAKALAQNTSWINLSVLGLYGNSIGAEGAKALAENTSWSHLSRLHLYSNSIGSGGVDALKQNKTWKDINILI